MLLIRPYLNTDTPALTRLWNAHHHAANSRSTCPVLVWDSCVLSKTYFTSNELRLALDRLGQPKGFIHFGFTGDETGNEFSSTHSAIHRICVLPCPEEDEIAVALISNATDYLKSQQASVCSGLGAAEQSPFYLGIADGDNLMGVPAHDTRTQKWLFESGFIPMRPTECWELELSSFRPPMDRMQIQARRTCSIGRTLEEDYEKWWLSSVLGHCEQIRFHLMTKSPTSQLKGELLCWFPDPTYPGVDSGVVRLAWSHPADGEESREQHIYLLAESLRQLQQERKRIVRTVASADRQHEITILQRLGFRSVEHGLLFEKQL